jgi:hypothetical protein
MGKLKSVIIAVFLLSVALPLAGASDKGSKSSSKPIADANQFSGESKKAYELAAKHEDVIKNVKCHCGCMESLKHKGLHTCFETDHGDHCVSCRAEIFRVAELKEQGKSNSEIVKQIDKEFGNKEHHH